ncbi:MAG: hypothetical protein WC058_02120 [Phycisphaeraceae bacterium]
MEPDPNRECIERQLLDRDVTEASLDHDPPLAEQVRRDPALMETLQAFDVLRAAMQLPDEILIEEPPGGWPAMERRMLAVIRSGSLCRTDSPHHL